MLIRPLEISDRQAIGRIGRESRQRLDDLMNKPCFAGLVAVLSRQPVGFVAGFAAAHEADIIDLAVQVDYRRRGIGRRLIEAFCEQYGKLATSLEVAANNDPALALYRGAGFVEVGVRKAYYRNDDGRVDALIMRRLAADPA